MIQLLGHYPGNFLRQSHLLALRLLAAEFVHSGQVKGESLIGMTGRYERGEERRCLDYGREISVNSAEVGKKSGMEVGSTSSTRPV